MALKDEYLTVAQAAKELQVTRQTISRWIAQKYVPAERVGRVVLIKKEDLRKYHARRISESAADSIMALVGVKLNEYVHNAGIIDEGEKLREIRPQSRGYIVIARKPDGSLRTVKITKKQYNEAFAYCREPLAKFLYEFNQEIRKKYPELIDQESTKKRRKTTK